MTNENTTYFDERFMNVRSAFITNTQSAELVQPTQSAFNHPPINTQAATVFSSPLRENRFNSFAAKLVTMRLRIIAPITLHAIRFLTRPSRLSGNGRNRLNQWQQLGYIVTIGPGQCGCKRDSFAIGDDVVFGAQFPSIRGIRTCFRPPKTARTEPESTTAREKSIWSDSRSLLSKTLCTLSHIPAFCQSRSRRQQVIPEPQPISCGRYSHGMPVLSTNRIPVKTSRLPTGGLPPLGDGSCLGNMGSIICHNSSGNSGLAMSLSSVTNSSCSIFNHCNHRPSHYKKSRFC